MDFRAFWIFRVGILNLHAFFFFLFFFTSREIEHINPHVPPFPARVSGKQPFDREKGEGENTFH